MLLFIRNMKREGAEASAKRKLRNEKIRKQDQAGKKCKWTLERHQPNNPRTPDKDSSSKSYENMPNPSKNRRLNQNTTLTKRWADRPQYKNQGRLLA